VLIGFYLYCGVIVVMYCLFVCLVVVVLEGVWWVVVFEDVVDYINVGVMFCFVVVFGVDVVFVMFCCVDFFYWCSVWVLMGIVF